MSYPYRIKVSKAVERDVRAGDKVKNTLQIDEIIETAETSKLIEEALKKRGYTDEGDGKWVKELESGEKRVVDVKSREVESSVELGEKITKEKTLEVVGDAYNRQQREAQKRKHKEDAEARLARTLKISDEEIAKKEEELVKAIAKVLADGADERKRELLEVVAEVQAESLKKKAASLGSIVSVEESTSADGQDYELRIKIAE